MRWMGLAAGLLAGVAASPGWAASFERLFVFGDSLSDTGRTYELTRGEIPRSPPYFDGRFSNGPVWVEQLAPLIGTQPDQDTNFAYGGAETGRLSQAGVPGVVGQLVQFAVADPSGRAGSLFAVWAGGNDYMNYLAPGTDPEPLIGRTVGNLVTAVEQLAALGGRTFLVPNLPDLGETPDARGTSMAAALNAATAAHNARLAQAMVDVERRLGIKVVVADVATLYRQVKANPAAFGFANWTTPCLSDGAATGACATEAAADATVFWDELHPTRAAHLLLAQYIGGTLTALNDAAETVAMQPELTSRLAKGWHRAVLDADRSDSARAGRVTAFLIGDAAWGRQSGSDAQEGFRYDAQVGGVGAELDVGTSSRIGIAIGAGRGHATLAEGAGKLEVTSTIVGLHASTQARGFSLAAAGSLGFDRYGDIRRTTGFVTMPTASAKTTGHTVALSLEGGYTAEFGALSVGPHVGLLYTDTRIDSYGEAGGGPLSLTVDGQRARSVESSVGIEASARLTLAGVAVEPGAAVGWRHRFAGDSHTVTVRLPGGGRNSVSAGGEAENALVLGAGVSANLTSVLSARIAYEGELRGADGHEHALTARVRARF